MVDTREQDPYLFAGLNANADKKHAKIEVATRRLGLKDGDYSIFGHPGIAVERKSKADLFGSVARRENFEGRLARMADLHFAAVIVEAEWSEILSSPPHYSKLNPKALFRTILSWQQRYRGVHWLMMPGRPAAEAATFRMLELYWKAQQAD